MKKLRADKTWGMSECLLPLGVQSSTFSFAIETNKDYNTWNYNSACCFHKGVEAARSHEGRTHTQDAHTPGAE